MKQRSYHPEKKRTTRLILPLFITFIMIASAFGIIFSGYSSPPDGQDRSLLTIDGVQFSSLPSGRWKALFRDGRTLELQFGPRDLPPLSLDLVPLHAAQKVYLSASQDDYYNALPDLRNALLPSVSVFFACYEDVPGCENFPLKDCGDAGNGVVVIRLKASEQDSATLEQGCYLLQGSPVYLNKVADALALAYSGVHL